MLASPWFPQHKPNKVFFFGFWFIAENKLCDLQKFLILTHFCHEDNQMNTTFMSFGA